MTDILDEASAVVQCKECPWYKSCVMPMRFTAEDLRKQMPNSASFAEGDAAISRYLGELASATQNFLLEGCPVFIERLRSNPKLAERMKQIMKTWGMEENT
ncbi:hypothetical protein ACFLVI_01930 [Chloroflexota bacterium]